MQNISQDTGFQVYYNNPRLFLIQTFFHVHQERIRGRTVTAIVPGSQAELLGIQPGWTIEKVNNKRVSISELHSILEDSTPRTINITFQVPDVSLSNKFMIFHFNI